MSMILDIWFHHHKHGVDVYPIFRSDGSPLSSEDQVVAEIETASSFDPDDGDWIEAALTGVPVPQEEEE